MAKRLVIEEATTITAQPKRWNIVLRDHDDDETIPVGETRMDCIVYYCGDAIPQRKMKNRLNGIPTGRRNHVKGWLYGISDDALEEHAAQMGLTTEDDPEDVIG